MNVVHENGKVEMEFLHFEQALELFSHKPFGESKPSYAFVKIAKEVVNACGGLPLNLEVMGSWLRTKHFFILWEEALSRFKCVQLSGGGNENEKLWYPLKISFEDLADEKCEMFLDIACIFSDDEFDLEVGKVLQIWSGPQSSPWTSFQNLKDILFIQVSDDKKMVMHDQLRNMGQSIVIITFGKIPLNQSRIWDMEEVKKMLITNEVIFIG